MNPARWIKETCEHQHATTPEDFIGMARAYQTAVEMVLKYGIGAEDHPPLDYIKLVSNGAITDYRTTPVIFADLSVGVSGNLIPRNVQRLLNAVTWDLDAAEFYQRFEEIHPFADGNGRVGAILYNVFNRTIDDPIHPPEFQKGWSNNLYHNKADNKRKCQIYSAMTKSANTSAAKRNSKISKPSRKSGLTKIKTNQKNNWFLGR